MGDTDNTEAAIRPTEGGHRNTEENRQHTLPCFRGVIRSVSCFCVSVFLWCAAPGPLAAEDSGKVEPATVRKTEANLHFQVPPDWPVEERGGIVGPIPIEEYLAKKFKLLEGRLQAMEQRLNGLDIRLRVLEEGAGGRRTQSLRSSEGASTP